MTVCLDSVLPFTLSSTVYVPPRSPVFRTDAPMLTCPPPSTSAGDTLRSAMLKDAARVCATTAKVLRCPIVTDIVCAAVSTVVGSSIHLPATASQVAMTRFFSSSPAGNLAGS